MSKDIATMQRLGAMILAGALAILATGGAHAEPAGELRGHPEVVDGDTIALGGHRLRLHGVDAPELGQTCRIKGRAYDCGMVARTALLDLTAGTPVVCRLLENAPALPDTAPDEKAARCTAGGYDLSEGMAYTGWALAQRDVTKRHVAHEARARERRHGLWKGAFVTPWDWRAGKRSGMSQRRRSRE